MSVSRSLHQLIGMKRSPGADWKIADVRALCEGLDLTGKSFPHGSHFVVSHPNVPGLLTIPSKKADKTDLRHAPDAVGREFFGGGMIIRGYEVEVHRPKPDFGGGFVAYAPVLVGCVSDGATQADALRQFDDAIECWLDAARSQGRAIPIPKDDLLRT